MYARSLVRYFELTAENSIPRFSEFNSAEPSHPRVVVPEITTDQYKKVFLVLKWLRGITTIWLLCPSFGILPTNFRKIRGTGRKRRQDKRLERLC